MEHSRTLDAPVEPRSFGALDRNSTGSDMSARRGSAARGGRRTTIVRSLANYSFVVIFALELTRRHIGQVSAGASDGSDQFVNNVFKYNEQEKSTDYWLRSGRQALEEALRYEPITRRAKSAIIFIGDGMSPSTITAARILYGQLLNKSGEEEQLAFDRLNNVALVKTYNVDQQVPDSAATATAILCGVKANFYTLGVNANVRLNDTNCQKVKHNQVSSILKQAQEAGKSTGIVTNTRITHATPAAAYAHIANRRWECDTYAPAAATSGSGSSSGVAEAGAGAAPCKDIARQLVEDEPGNRLNVVMGGGRRCFFGPDFIDPGPSGLAGVRRDGRNLIEHWLERRRLENERNFAFVNSTQDLRSVDTDKTDYLLGLFSFSHMNYEELRDRGPGGEPSLAEMTEVALKILRKNPLGYLLLVEGGRIDHAHHENIAGVALRETIALSWAVQAARNMVEARDTLLAVTSDHAHALTINGLAPRGNPILGVSRFKENATQVPYTTLIYGNGPGSQRPRPDPTAAGPNSTDSPFYVQHAAIHQEEAFHDGTDVAVFAAGPFAHLFQGVQEQSYIAHVFAYALCIGNYTGLAHCGRAPAPLPSPPSGAANPAPDASRPNPFLLDAGPDGWHPAATPNGHLGRPGGGGQRQQQPARKQLAGSTSGAGSAVDFHSQARLLIGLLVSSVFTWLTGRSCTPRHHHRRHPA